MRYVFGDGESTLSVTAHAPLHDSHATSTGLAGEFHAAFADGMPEPGVTGFAEVSLPSFSSGNRLLDMNTLRHIQARQFPVARFDIESVTTTADGVRIAGVLDFHGVQGSLDADATLEVAGDTVTIAGSWVLSQTRFGLKPPRLGLVKVGDGIDVEFRIVARASG